MARTRAELPKGTRITDYISLGGIVQVAREENPRLYILVRTRYAAEVEDLLKLGANEVIPEEFETSIEIFAKVLHHYQVPRNLMIEQIEKIRSGSYEVLRRVELPAKDLPQKCEILVDIDTETYLINDRSHASGRSIQELGIRSATGATLIAVKRGIEIIPSPGLNFVFSPGDILYLIGSKESLAKAFALLES